MELNLQLGTPFYWVVVGNSSTYTLQRYTNSTYDIFFSLSFDITDLARGLIKSTIKLISPIHPVQHDKPILPSL